MSKPSETNPEINSHKILYNFEAIRGIAAIIVLIRHSADIFFPIFFTMSYMAVDIFFMMSGFVLAKTYEEKMQNNLISIKDFFYKRIIRLFPMALIGSVLSAISFFIYKGNVNYLEFILNLFLLPYPSLSEIYMDQPLWSVFFELFVSILFSIYLCKKSSSKLFYIAALSFLIFLSGAILSKHNVFDMGNNPKSFLINAPRVIFGFTVGQVLFRLSKKNSVRKSDLMSLLCVIFVIIPLFFLPENKIEHLILGSIFLTIIFPFGIYMSSRCNPGIILQKISLFLGKISYPMYAIHFPSIYIFRMYVKSSGPVSGILFIISISLISYLIDVFYDIPVRKYLLKSCRKLTLDRNEQLRNPKVC